MNIKATIYKSKFPEQIHTTDKLYMEKLRKFYSNDIKIPKIHYSQLIQVLKQRYNISVIEIEESDLDNYTKDIMSDLLKNEHKLWKVLRNTYSDLFYKDFWDNYFEIDGKPELCIIYDFKEQEFMGILEDNHELKYSGPSVQCFELVPEHITGKIVKES